MHCGGLSGQEIHRCRPGRGAGRANGASLGPIHRSLFWSCVPQERFQDEHHHPVEEQITASQPQVITPLWDSSTSQLLAEARQAQALFQQMAAQSGLLQNATGQGSQKPQLLTSVAAVPGGLHQVMLPTGAGVRMMGAVQPSAVEKKVDEDDESANILAGMRSAIEQQAKPSGLAWLQSRAKPKTVERACSESEPASELSSDTVSVTSEAATAKRQREAGSGSQSKKIKL